MLQYYHIRGFQTPHAQNDNPVPAESFTADELFVLRRMARGEFVTQENSGLDTGCWQELMTRLGRSVSNVQNHA